MLITLGNFGNDSVALLQYLYEHDCANDCTMVLIDTGWAARRWQTRIKQGQAYAEQLGFSIVHLKSNVTFEKMVEEHRSFPDRKYQRCTLLKALPFNDYLDQVDAQGEATVVLSTRRSTARVYRQLPERVERGEHYGDRKVWYPMIELSENDRNRLIERAGFTVINHRSLECDPCIYNTSQDFLNMEHSEIDRVVALEARIGKPMFSKQLYDGHVGINAIIAHLKTIGTPSDNNYNENLTRSCGSYWACGE